MFKKLVAVMMAVAIGVFAAGGVRAEAAEAWPKEKPFTMLIPFATGGGTDFNARLVAKIMGDILGVRVNCINRTGDFADDDEPVPGSTLMVDGEIVAEIPTR